MTAGRHRRAFATLVTAVFTAAPVHAQDPESRVQPGPYSALTIGISGVLPMSAGSLATLWDWGNGVGVDVHTPFYVGELGVSVRAAPFRARTVAQPSFRAYLLGLDWRFGVAQSRWGRPTVSILAGDFLTVYDGEQAKGMGKESEIFIGGTAAIAVPVMHRTHLTAKVTALQVLTSTPIRLTYASVGAAHTLATPRWLHWALQ